MIDIDISDINCLGEVGGSMCENRGECVRWGAHIYEGSKPLDASFLCKTPEMNYFIRMSQVEINKVRRVVMGEE